MLLDMALNAHKGFYEDGKGRVSEEKGRIFMHYLKTQVYFDVLAVGVLVVPKLSQNPNVDLLLFIPIVLLWIKKFKYQN